MVELWRTNDLAGLSYAEALLKDAGLTPFILDAHMSVLEGSNGALPRRLVIDGDQAARAKAILRDAGLPIDA